MTRSRSSARASVIIVSIIASATVMGAGAYFYHKFKTETGGQAKAISNITTPIPPKATATPDSNQALTALFSITTSNKQVKPSKDTLASVWFEQSFDDGLDKYHAIFIKNQMVDPDSNEVYGSHADAPIISAVVYKRVNGKWELVSKQAEIGAFGSWGDAPDVEKAQVLTLAKGNIAFLLNIGYSGQGYTNSGKTLFAFKNNKWSQLGYLQTGGDNAGVCDDEAKDDDFLSPCWKFEGEIIAKNGANPDYPDLQVTRMGTMEDEEGKIVPVESSVYRFNGEEYREAGSEEK